MSVAVTPSAQHASTSSGADLHSDTLALLTHTISCVDLDDWMTHVMDFKTYMIGSLFERKTSPSAPLKHYAAIVRPPLASRQLHSHYVQTVSSRLPDGTQHDLFHPSWTLSSLSMIPSHFSPHASHNVIAA